MAGKDEGFGARITCACGCGGTLRELDDRGRPRKYLAGHNLKSLWRRYAEALAKGLEPFR